MTPSDEPPELGWMPFVIVCAFFVLLTIGLVLVMIFNDDSPVHAPDVPTTPTTAPG